MKDMTRQQLISLAQTMRRKLQTVETARARAEDAAQRAMSNVAAVDSVLVDSLGVPLFPHHHRRHRHPQHHSQHNSSPSAASADASIDTVATVDAAQLRRSLRGALRDRDADARSEATALRAQLAAQTADAEQRRSALKAQIAQLHRRCGVDAEACGTASVGLSASAPSLEASLGKEQAAHRATQTKLESVQARVTELETALFNAVTQHRQAEERLRMTEQDLACAHQHCGAPHGHGTAGTQPSASPPETAAATDSSTEDTQWKQRYEEVQRILTANEERIETLQRVAREAQVKSRNARTLIGRKDDEIGTYCPCSKNGAMPLRIDSKQKRNVWNNMN